MLFPGGIPGGLENVSLFQVEARAYPFPCGVEMEEPPFPGGIPGGNGDRRRFSGGAVVDTVVRNGRGTLRNTGSSSLTSESRTRTGCSSWTANTHALTQRTRYINRNSNNSNNSDNNTRVVP